jgi:hypothetical protein
MWFCSECGAASPSSDPAAKHCIECGATLPSDPGSLTRTVPLRPVVERSEGSVGHDTIRDVFAPPASKRTLLGGTAASPRVEPLPAVRPTVPGPQEHSAPSEDPVDDAERPAPVSYRRLGELGETAHPVLAPPRRKNPLGRARVVLSPDLRVLDGGHGVVPPPVRRPPHRAARELPRIVVLLGLGAVVAIVVAGLFVWRTRPPRVEARVRSTGAAERLELVCADCDDGTRVRLARTKSDRSESTWVDHRASLPLATPPPVGPSRLALELESKRDAWERFEAELLVGHRVRTDVAGLSDRTPRIDVDVEVPSRSSVVVDGHSVEVQEGTARHAVDVSEALLGPSSDGAARLERSIAVEVTSADGEVERSLASVVVGIVPLTLDAGERVITERPDFLLAGRTSPGATVYAGAYPLPVDRDGRFSQSMSVSAVGTTSLEVRATRPGSAPRTVRLVVERVDRATRAATEGGPP